MCFFSMADGTLAKHLREHEEEFRGKQAFSPFGEYLFCMVGFIVFPRMRAG